MGWFLRKKRGAYNTTLNTSGRATASRGWNIFGRQRVTGSMSIGKGGGSHTMTTLRFGNWQKRSRSKGLNGLHFVGAAVVGFFDWLFFRPKPVLKLAGPKITSIAMARAVLNRPRDKSIDQRAAELMAEERRRWRREQRENEMFAFERSQVV